MVRELFKHVDLELDLFLLVLNTQRLMYSFRLPFFISQLRAYLGDVHHFDGGQLAGLGVATLRTTARGEM